MEQLKICKYSNNEETICYTVMILLTFATLAVALNCKCNIMNLSSDEFCGQLMLLRMCGCKIDYCKRNYMNIIHRLIMIPIFIIVLLDFYISLVCF
jgi:hypothetical protein